MTNRDTFKRALTRWLVRQRNGKAASTRHYYWEIIKTIRRHWRDAFLKNPADLTDEDVQQFAIRVGHYSPSRWNAMVAVLRATVPAGKSLKRRKVKLTRLPPPNQTEFSRLLVECDALKKSQARLVVDFLARTGLRITAARNVRWSDVYEDRIEYIAKGGRRCSTPIINGIGDVLTRLRAITDASGYVLPREAVRRGLAKACQRAGLRPLNNHDFRHMFVTRCIVSGVDVPTVARWIGHGDGGALLSKRYFHLLDEHSRTMAAKVRI